jgi:hypothetical protein
MCCCLYTHLFVMTLHLLWKAARQVRAKVLVTIVTAVGAKVTDQGEGHALMAVGTDEGWRQWPQGSITQRRLLTTPTVRLNTHSHYNKLGQIKLKKKYV